MRVQFIFPDGKTVSYGWPGREPVEKEWVWFDGSDPEVPNAVYKVVKTTWNVGERGPDQIQVLLGKFSE